MQSIITEIDAVKILVPKKFGDQRGFFSETYSRKALLAFGIDLTFVQDNQSLSVEKGVLRGLHYQVPPFAQDKLVRVLHGSILDVAVDIRRGSPTFGRHVRRVLSADNREQILIPIGFAHAFLTLEPNTEVLYKVTNDYSPAHERGILWNDPDLGIDWGASPEEVIQSERDKRHPRLRDAVDPF